MQRELKIAIVTSIAAVGAIAASCASTQQQSQPLSADEHEAQAEHHQRLAEEHSGEHHIGWTETPTSSEEAARYHAIAEEHRAASAALREAEARACVGIEEIDRDESPFVHRADILSVTELNERSGKQQVFRRKGVRIVLRSVPGLTAQWLQRLVDCRVAENAALGYDVPEFPHDPLAVPDVQTQVTPVRTGFAVDITHESPERAREIQERAQALAPGSGSASE